MATKSKTAAEKENYPEIEAQEAPVKEPAAVKSAWDEEEEMLIPRKAKGEEQHYYICVNDRRFYVPANGKMQKLPKPIAQALKDSLDAEYEADEYADHIPNRDASNPQIHAI